MYNLQTQHILCIFTWDTLPELDWSHFLIAGFKLSVWFSANKYITYQIKYLSGPYKKKNQILGWYNWKGLDSPPSTLTSKTWLNFKSNVPKNSKTATKKVTYCPNTFWINIHACTLSQTPFFFFFFAAEHSKAKSRWGLRTTWHSTQNMQTLPQLEELHCGFCVAWTNIQET